MINERILYFIIIVNFVFPIFGMDNLSANLFQINKIIHIYKQYNKLSSNKWFLQSTKISEIKNDSDREKIREVISVLVKELEKTNLLIRDIKDMFSRESTKNEELKNSIDKLQEAIKNSDLLLNLVKKLVEYCLKNSETDYSAIDKLLSEEKATKRNEVDMSNFKNLFENFIKEVEGLYIKKN